MNNDRIISIWKLEDEAQGILLQKVLKEEGIISELKSEQIPWMDGIMKAARGYWGDLMILESDHTKAREVIELYLSQKETDTQTDM